jgi:mannose/cellobiose epimerase-like protein (N-acyl-D-glucosamine 2-epimerase family)
MDNNMKEYFKKRLIEAIVSESKKRDFGEPTRNLSDPKNFGIDRSKLPPGSVVSGGNIIDNAERVWHNTEMLKAALKINHEEEIKKYSEALKRVGGDPDSVIAQHKGK